MTEDEIRSHRASIAECIENHESVAWTEWLTELVDEVERLAAENAELREAGNALAKAGLRVVLREGTTQRYEYLLTAIERWEALVGTEEG